MRNEIENYVGMMQLLSDRETAAPRQKRKESL
jgi:hypothetical protein